MLSCSKSFRLHFGSSQFFSSEAVGCVCVFSMSTHVILASPKFFDILQTTTESLPASRKKPAKNKTYMSGQFRIFISHGKQITHTKIIKPIKSHTD